MRCFWALIHKVLETQIPGFLEPHIVVKCLLDQIIHLALELKELQGELVGVLQVLLILHDVGALLQNIRVHLVDDMSESGRGPVEHLVHHAQLVDLVLRKHVLAPCVLLGQGLSLVFHCLLEEDVHHLALRLLLQKVVSVILFFLQMEGDFLDVLRG